ncbi:MAG: fasciclin domain-containing protein [Anaerolineales bacterium]|nr:fasciclin domain-containing protein [Anaerolineales bacterium]
MLKSRLAKLLVMALAVVMVVPVIGVSAQDGTVVDVILGSPDHTTLALAVDLAGVADMLSNADAEYTVFAPTDAAFGGVSPYVTNAALSDTELLTALLSYHVVAGKIMSADIAEGCNDVETLLGETLKICKSDAGVTVNSASVTTADLEASNGVVHVIDGVVIPPVELPEIDPLDYEGSLVIIGSGTVYPLSKAINQRWEDEGGNGVAIDLQDPGSSAGFEAFCVEAKSDIANASRGAKDSDYENCAGIGRDLIEFRIGTDALVVMVNPANSLTGVTIEDLAKIFSGEAKTWGEIDPSLADLGDIELYSPGSEHGTYGYFVEEVFDNDSAALDNSGAQFVAYDFLVQGVASSPGAIGYAGYAYYIENSDIVKPLDIEGVTPSGANVDNGSYPLARPLFMYSSESSFEANPIAAAYVAYYLNVVNEEIGAVGYFPASIDGLNTARLSWYVANEDMMME